MHFNNQNLNTDGLKFRKCRIISSLNSFSVCIFYIASKSMLTNLCYENTLLNDSKFLLRLKFDLSTISHINILLFSVLFPDDYVAPNQACRLRLRIRTDLAISLSRSSRGGLLGGRCQSTWNFRRLKAKNSGKKKKSRMPKMHSETFYKYEFSP